MKSTTNVAIDSSLYQAVAMEVGPANVAQTIEALVMQSFSHSPRLDAAYAEMAADGKRETEALEWSEGLLCDVSEGK
ncbi:hypothetical protein LJC22_04715 [Desulfosarcina sp. OttesenSCG-928-G10]|nr:hypothetical protein [Desulfosarcina sp. OttesenSCG-928-G10]MDL2322300.1 hypothetical protein [Desulfosarcina sp. OttesenSCG-928-B08]